MTDQLALLGPARTITQTGRTLTPLQQLVYDRIRASHNGLDAAEVGAILHAHRGRRPHAVDERCVHCAADGSAVLRSRALRPLLIRRRSGMWEAREPFREPGDDVNHDDPEPTPGSPNGQLRHLPGDSWKDIFEGAA